MSSSDPTIHLYEAGRLPAALRVLAAGMIQAAGVKMLAMASPADDAGTTIICVPSHALVPAAMIINEVARRYAPITQDALSGGSLPAEAEGIQ